jgi:ABC-type bacteriocin/lantibiotic exporter with double-glycine peptidase domain
MNSSNILIESTLSKDLCIQQKQNCDCVVTCLSMASRVERNTIMSLIYPEIDFSITGLNMTQIKYGARRLGFKINQVKFFSRGKPALVILPGLNRANALHCVFWNGVDLCDPQNGKNRLRAYTYESATQTITPPAIIFACLELELSR